MKQLNVIYYTIMALTIALLTLFYYLVSKGMVICIEPQTMVGNVIQYVVIFDALITIPVGLFWFKKQCKKIAKIEDESLRKSQYIKGDKIRIMVVSNSMVLAVIAYCLLGFYRSMIWVAAMAAIGWYFTKPTEAKMQKELLSSEDQY